MPNKLALSASVLALAGQSCGCSERPLDGRAIVAFDDALPSVSYL